MNFLTDKQRENALILLAEGPDEIILSAMVDLRRFRHLEEGTKRNLNEVIDELKGEATPVPEEAPRKNISPGTPAITKIGAVAKDYVLEALRMKQQPSTKYEEHLKLLWSRGEVKYDGEEFYL